MSQRECEKLKKQVMTFIPYNKQEEADKSFILEALNIPDIFERKNRAMHMTASAWVVNADMDKVLMVYHNLYHSWSWLGGHADGETNLLNVAVCEVREESGLDRVIPVLEDDIYSLEVLTVDGHVKKGKYVSSHLHLNVTYLLQADERDLLKIKPDENSGVAWFGLNEAVNASTEPWFQENIYKKLNQKLALFRACKI